MGLCRTDGGVYIPYFLPHDGRGSVLPQAPEAGGYCCSVSGVALRK